MVLRVETPGIHIPLPVAMQERPIAVDPLVEPCGPHSQSIRAPALREARPRTTTDDR